MARQYDEDANFNNRFVVETNVNGEIVDQQEFMKRQYKDSLNSVYMPPEGSGLPTVTRGQRSKVKPPQPRPKRALEKQQQIKRTLPSRKQSKKT